MTALVTPTPGRRIGTVLASSRPLSWAIRAASRMASFARGGSQR